LRPIFTKESVLLALKKSTIVIQHESYECYHESPISDTTNINASSTKEASDFLKGKPTTFINYTRKS
jgi:hypothetical protein